MKRKAIHLKIRVSEILLCFKDKESDKKVLVFCKNKVYVKSYQIYAPYEKLSFITMKVIIFYEKFMKKSFIIL